MAPPCSRKRRPLAALSLRIVFWTARSEASRSLEPRRCGHDWGRFQAARLDRFGRARSGPRPSAYHRPQDWKGEGGAERGNRRRTRTAAAFVFAGGGKSARRDGGFGASLLLYPRRWF